MPKEKKTDDRIATQPWSTPIGSRVAKNVCKSKNDSPSVVLENEEQGWRFTFDASEQIRVSSGIKAIARGTFENELSVVRRRQGAFALVFAASRMESFVQECMNLWLANSYGIGPRLLSQSKWDSDLFPEGIFPKKFFECNGPSDEYYVLIEEDVGVSLESALFRNAPLPNGKAGCCAAPLHPIGTPEREEENGKIALDIASRLKVLHGNMLFHRDLRSANVCVRRFGDKPEDIRATVIDFDLSTSSECGKPKGREKALYSLLFEDKNVLPEEHDIAYFEALAYELETGACVVGDGREGFLKREPRYWKDGILKDMRSLDVEKCAWHLGLESASSLCVSGSSDFAALSSAMNRLRIGPYIDSVDMDALENDLEYGIFRHREKIARKSFEEYKKQRREQGEEPEYERFEDQPDHLQGEGIDSFLDYKKKVEALGYHLEWTEEPKQEDAISSLSDEEVESIAKGEHERWLASLEAKGYRKGESKDHEKKIHPLFGVGWEDLDETEKDKDRRIARQIIPFMAELGISVCSNDRFDRHTF